MLLVITVLFTWFSCTSCALIKNDCIYPEKIGNQPDYYWRDYFGEVPKDAVPGGYDDSGNVTYIGQLAASLVGIFPGNLYPGRKAAVYCPGKTVTDDVYVKILCSNPSNKFQWVATTADDSHLLTDYHWVRGGSQSSYLTFIGRAHLEGQVQIGRVFDSSGDSSVKGLWVCNKAGTHLNFKSFELLVLAR